MQSDVYSRADRKRRRGFGGIIPNGLKYGIVLCQSEKKDKERSLGGNGLQRRN